MRADRVAHELMDSGRIRFNPKKDGPSHRFVKTQLAVIRAIGNEGMHWHEKKPRVKPTSKPTGYTKAKLAAWGVPWPPPRGWKRKLIASGVIAEGPDVPVADAPYDQFAAIWVTP